MTKTALITGITGQDGSYLTEFLLEKGYTVSFFLVIIYVYVCMYMYSFLGLDQTMKMFAIEYKRDSSAGDIIDYCNMIGGHFSGGEGYSVGG